MANKIVDYAYELQKAEDSMSSTLASCNSWRDDVRRSYEIYVSDMKNQVSTLSFLCNNVSSIISNVSSIDVKKYKSEFEALVKRVRSI